MSNFGDLGSGYAHGYNPLTTYTLTINNILVSGYDKAVYSVKIHYLAFWDNENNYIYINNFDNRGRILVWQSSKGMYAVPSINNYENTTTLWSNKVNYSYVPPGGDTTLNGYNTITTKEFTFNSSSLTIEHQTLLNEHGGNEVFYISHPILYLKPITPLLILNGSINMYVSLNSSYTDQGVSLSFSLEPNLIPYIVSIKGSNGNELITEQLNALNNNVLNMINTTIENIYTISYKVTTTYNVSVYATRTITIINVMNIINEWLNRITLAGGSLSQNEINAHIDFIIILKQNNAWDKIVRLNTFCGSNLQAALCPIKIDGGLSNNGASLNDTLQNSNPTYNRTGGIQGTGSGALNTGLKLSTLSNDGTNLHLGMWSFNELSGRSMGVLRSWVYTRHYLLYDDGGAGWGSQLSLNTNSSSIGMTIIQCRTNENPYYYRNNIKTNLGGNVDRSTPSDWPCTLFGANGSGDGTNPNNSIYGDINYTNTTRSGGYTIGYGLTEQQLTDIYNAFNVLNQTLLRS